MRTVFVDTFYFGFFIIFVVVIVLVVRWQLRFSHLNTSDPDYAKARRSKNLAFVLWLVALVALPVGFIFREVLFYLLHR